MILYFTNFCIERGNVIIIFEVLSFRKNSEKVSIEYTNSQWSNNANYRRIEWSFSFIRWQKLHLVNIRTIVFKHSFSINISQTLATMKIFTSVYSNLCDILIHLLQLSSHTWMCVLLLFDTCTLGSIVFYWSCPLFAPF